MIWGDEENTIFNNIDYTKTMQGQLGDDAGSNKAINGGWSHFEQLAEEEERPSDTDEPPTTHSNATANRRRAMEENNQWGQEEDPSTNDSAEPEVRPRLRDRRAINPPAKLDL